MLFILVLCLVAFLLAFLLHSGGGAVNLSQIGPWPYYVKKPLSIPEQVLFFRLVEALPDCIILSQVQLSRVLGVKKGHPFTVWHNKINRMSLDFVVCLKDSTIVAVIELDDKSHEKPDRISADNKKDRALESAEVTILRWQVTNIPTVDEIKKTFLT